MTVEQCFMGVCFVPLDGGGQKFFGFSEFLAGLALMVLAWTTADVRYRFRVQSAPIPLLYITFWVVATVGVLTLLTDLWRAEQWCVPQGIPITLASWQAFLGGSFLLTFLTWTRFAFIRPPRFSRYNAERFRKALRPIIVKGSPTELAVIADELAHSVHSIVRHAPSRVKNKDEKPSISKVEVIANDLLSLIADKRLCRAIVGDSPVTAQTVFQTMTELEKYGIQIKRFARNIIDEALANEDSFLYHEADEYNKTNEYRTAPTLEQKSISQTIFSNYELIETVGTLLDPDAHRMAKYKTTQWEAYCRIVRMSLESYVATGFKVAPKIFIRAMWHISSAASASKGIDGIFYGTWGKNPKERLNVFICFVRDSINIINKEVDPWKIGVFIKNRKESNTTPSDENINHVQSIYDEISTLTCEVVIASWLLIGNWTKAKAVVWNKIDCLSGDFVKHMVFNRIYDEIADLERFPGHSRAPVLLGYCLDQLGFTPDRANDKFSLAFHQDVLEWTKKHYARLHRDHPHVAEKCLVNGMTYDEKNERLVRTYPANMLQREPVHEYLDLDPLPPEPAPDMG